MVHPRAPAPDETGFAARRQHGFFGNRAPIIPQHLGSESVKLRFVRHREQ